MKRVVFALLVVALAAGTAFAADVITYPSEKCDKGPVVFDHKGHADKMACDKCHPGEPAKIVVDKNSAHKEACKDCHKTDGGPTKCGDCHKK